MTKIKRRHWAVDVGLLVSGSFFSAAITSKSIGYGAAAFIVGLLTIWHDRRNIEDEEHEAAEATKTTYILQPNVPSTQNEPKCIC